MKRLLCAVYTAIIESRKQQADLYVRNSTIGWY